MRRLLEHHPDAAGHIIKLKRLVRAVLPSGTHGIKSMQIHHRQLRRHAAHVNIRAGKFHAKRFGKRLNGKLGARIGPGLGRIFVPGTLLVLKK